MFRRRNKGAAGEEPEGSDELSNPDGDDAGAAAVRPTGPWDIEDIPDDGVQRLDLGGLQIPALPEVEVRLETEPSGAVLAVVLVSGASSLQLGAFAAPRRSGIWDDVRAELLESLLADGHKGQERVGPFGSELRAVVPGERGNEPARFVGVDGPRWFLRGVFTGPSATNAVQAELLESALRQVVVSRGGDALPVRDPLPLAMPPDVAAAGEGDEDAPRAPQAPQRGPEITEIG